MLLSTQSTSTRGYDPLLDVNDDGAINIVDLALLAIHFDTYGTPMNRTTGATPGYVNQPAWDSGWKTCALGTNVYYFNKTIDSQNSMIYLIGKNDTNGLPHQIDYGGTMNVGYSYGTRWQDLTNSSITVIRRGNDESWNYVRILIWQIMDP
jgi:hypothetical protein